MRNAFVVSGILIALLIAGAAWTRQPATAARIASFPTDMADRTTLTGDGAHENTANENGTGSSKGELSRRLLGVWLLTVSGAVAVRARRPLTI